MEQHQKLNDVARTKRTLSVLRQSGTINMDQFVLLRHAPGTAQNVRDAVKDYCRRTGVSPLRMRYTVKLFEEYVRSLLNCPKWQSMGAVHSRAKVLRAEATRQGAKKAMRSVRVTAIVASLQKMAGTDPVRQAHPITILEMHKLSILQIRTACTSENARFGKKLHEQLSESDTCT